MNQKATAPVRSQKLRLKLPCLTVAVTASVKFRRPNRAPLFSTPWQCAPESPGKCFRTRARLRPRICKSGLLSPPTSPGSNRRAFCKREYFGRRFGDERVSQDFNGDSSRSSAKPDICAIRACIPINLDYTFNKNNCQPVNL